MHLKRIFQFILKAMSYKSFGLLIFFFFPTPPVECFNVAKLQSFVGKCHSEIKMYVFVRFIFGFLSWESYPNR